MLPKSPVIILSLIHISDDQVNWEELRKCGIDKEKLSEKDLKALMNYGLSLIHISWLIFWAVIMA